MDLITYALAKKSGGGSFSGDYNDLINKPVIPPAGDYVTAGQKAGTTLGEKATAEGFNTTASAAEAHAEGTTTEATGPFSHAEGANTKATNSAAHAEGRYTEANHTAAHAEGNYSKANGSNAHAEGNHSNASGNNAHAEGDSTEAIGSNSHAEGEKTTAIGVGSHAEGQSSSTFQVTLQYSEKDDAFTIINIPSGKSLPLYRIVQYNNIYGYISDKSNDLYTIALQTSYTFTDGENYIFVAYIGGAYGQVAHIEGEGTIAIGEQSHAEGAYTKAIGRASHAEGASSQAIATYSHVEGNNTTAIGRSSHVEGSDTISTHSLQHVFGKYNALDPSSSPSIMIGTYVEIVGNGFNDNNRSNARTLDWAGNEVLKGTLTVSSNGITIGNTTITESQLQQLINATINKGNITLTANGWTGNAAPYTQTISSIVATSSSKIDLYPNVTVLTQMQTDGTTNIFVDNNNGILTAYALGAKPTASLTIQYTKMEVVS